MDNNYMNTEFQQHQNDPDCVTYSNTTENEESTYLVANSDEGSNTTEYENLTEFSRYSETEGFFFKNSNGYWYKVLSYDFKNKVGLLHNQLRELNGFRDEYIIASGLDLLRPYNSGYSWGHGSYYYNLSKAYFDYINRIINDEIPMSDNVINNITLTMNEVDFGVTFVSLTDYEPFIKEGQVYTIMNIFAPIYREEDDEEDRIFEIGLINDVDEEPLSVGYMKYSSLSELISSNELLRYTNKDE